jgi:hypothetical protein
LVANLESVAADAGISPDRIWTSMHDTDATPAEIEYLRAFRRQAAILGKYGLVFVGENPQRDIIAAMSYLAGALLRNRTRARVMPVADVLDYMASDGHPDHTCLLIPDFHELIAGQQKATRHRISKLVSLLLKRQAAGLQTILYVSDMNAMQLEYGNLIGRHITSHYHFVDVG